MGASAFHKAVCKEPFPVDAMTCKRLHRHLLLIVFAICLFLFLSHKIVILLEIQVNLLANPILPIRGIKIKPEQSGVLCMQRCGCAPEVVEPTKDQMIFE